MIDINKRLTENQKDFFNRLSINVDDIYIHFYGSIKRLDYIENKSDIDIDIFTNNENSTIIKLSNFLNINKSDFKKIVYVINNRIIVGYKTKYIDEKKNINVEMSIYNEKYKEIVIKKHDEGINLPFYKLILLYIIKVCYYNLKIVSSENYSILKNIINHNTNERNFILL